MAAVELRDGGERYRGFDVETAVGHASDEIAPALIGRDASDQRGLDALLREPDGTVDKRRLGATALCGVSLALARVAAAAAGLPRHRYLRFDSCVLPVPLVNLIGGGRLTSNDLAFQEFIMMPVGARSFGRAWRMASDSHMALQEIVVARYGKLSANTGDEGDFATPIVDVHEALALVREGVAAAGHAEQVVYGFYRAAAHLWDPQTRRYSVRAAPTPPRSSSSSTRSSWPNSTWPPSKIPSTRTTGRGSPPSRGLPGVQIVGDDLRHGP